MMTTNRPLAWLPNQEGFRFIGIFKDGSKRECVVTTRTTDKGTILHTVENYGELKEWQTITKKA